MPSAQRRVLLVDDSPLVLALLREALEARDVIVDTATNLEELERRRAAASPDVIVLDVHMPEAWGDDVASTLRGAYGVKVPILLMSTLGPEELASRAAASGVDGWVSKEEGVEHIAARISALLGVEGDAS